VFGGNPAVSASRAGATAYRGSLIRVAGLRPWKCPGECRPLPLR
jgi:hypothetical protein